MDAASNGGLLYHEVQEGKLCAVHCVNTALQGPFFSEFDLAALAADLDQRERQVMLQGLEAAAAAATAAGDFLAEGEGSHNVSLGGDFSIQALDAHRLLGCRTCGFKGFRWRWTSDVERCFQSRKKGATYSFKSET